MTSTLVLVLCVRGSGGNGGIAQARGLQRGSEGRPGAGDSRLAGNSPSRAGHSSKAGAEPLSSTPAQLTWGLPVSGAGWERRAWRQHRKRGSGRRARCSTEGGTREYVSGRQGVQRSWGAHRATSGPAAPTALPGPGTRPPARPPGDHCAQTHVPGPRAPCDRWRLHQDLVWLFLSGGEKLLLKSQRAARQKP